jgi:uncharacterized protein (TIGR02118 family)
MVKLIVAVKRRADLSPEAFRAHWRDVHAPLVRGAACTRRYVRSYVQAMTLPGSYADGAEPAYDGTAELHFDSLADQQAFFSDPEYLERIHPDERNFADLERCAVFVTREESVI